MFNAPKICPDCNGENITSYTTDMFYIIECDDCMFTVMEEDQDLALKAWDKNNHDNERGN